MQLISGQLNPSLIMVDPAGVATLATIWDSVHPLLYQLQHQLNGAALRVVVDAYFSKAPFVNPLLAKGIQVVSKLRHDAVGWDDPAPHQRSDAKRGPKWKLAHLLTHGPTEALKVQLYGQTVMVQAVWRQVWLRDFNQKVKVVVVEGLKKPIILFSTDVELSAVQIIEIYGARFVIEIVFRWLRQTLQLDDHLTSYHPRGILRQILTVLIVWGLLIIANQDAVRFSPKQMWRQLQADLHQAILEFGYRLGLKGADLAFE